MDANIHILRYASLLPTLKGNANILPAVVGKRKKALQQVREMARWGRTSAEAKGKWSCVFCRRLITDNIKDRTDFDFGDFTLSTAHRVTDDSANQTGKAHLYRRSISHPYSLVSATSNAEVDANQDTRRKNASPEISPFLQHSSIEYEDPTKKKEQDNQTSHHVGTVQNSFPSTNWKQICRSAKQPPVHILSSYSGGKG